MLPCAPGARDADAAGVCADAACAAACSAPRALFCRAASGCVVSFSSFSVLLLSPLVLRHRCLCSPKRPHLLPAPCHWPRHHHRTAQCRLLRQCAQRLAPPARAVGLAVVMLPLPASPLLSAHSRLLPLAACWSWKHQYCPVMTCAVPVRSWAGAGAGAWRVTAAAVVHARQARHGVQLTMTSACVLLLQ